MGACTGPGMDPGHDSLDPAATNSNPERRLRLLRIRQLRQPLRRLPRIDEDGG